MPESAISAAADLILVGRTYRQVRHSGSSRADARQTALDTYCSLHPEVAEATASEAEIIKVLLGSRPDLDPELVAVRHHAAASRSPSLAADRHEARASSAQP